MLVVLLLDLAKRLLRGHVEKQLAKSSYSLHHVTVHHVVKDDAPTERKLTKRNAKSRHIYILCRARISAHTVLLARNKSATARDRHRLVVAITHPFPCPPTPLLPIALALGVIDCLDLSFPSPQRSDSCVLSVKLACLLFKKRATTRSTLLCLDPLFHDVCRGAGAGRGTCGIMHYEELATLCV